MLLSARTVLVAAAAVFLTPVLPLVKMAALAS
jgi:hypothetical protein